MTCVPKQSRLVYTVAIRLLPVLLWRDNAFGCPDCVRLRGASGSLRCSCCKYQHYEQCLVISLGRFHIGSSIHLFVSFLYQCIQMHGRFCGDITGRCKVEHRACNIRQLVNQEMRYRLTSATITIIRVDGIAPFQFVSSQPTLGHTDIINVWF